MAIYRKLLDIQGRFKRENFRVLRYEYFGDLRKWPTCVIEAPYWIFVNLMYKILCSVDVRALTNASFDRSLVISFNETFKYET